MNNYEYIKKRLMLIWYYISSDNVSEELEVESRRSFMRAIDIFISTVYFCFFVFSCISVYLFLTRVIF